MKTKTLFIITLLLSYIIMAQNGINYKAVINDNNGNVIANQQIDLRFSILKGFAQTVVYSETHATTTDSNGIVIVNIGEGTPSIGDFNTIDWGSDSHFLNVQINTGGGLTDLGTTEFKTVPYAINAINSNDSYWKKSGTVVHNNIDDIGIGNDTLNAKLGIFHNSSMSDPQILLHENGNDYARLKFKNNNGSNHWTIAAYIGDKNKNDRLNFWNDIGGDVMTITGDGEVGIGVGISPKVDFHIGNQKRVLFGTDTLGSGDKLMWLPDLHAFRVGTVATGPPSTYWNRDSIGLYSFASGLNTRAQGFGATAMGRDTEATNSYAFASGFFTNAYGQFSTAMGYLTNAESHNSTAIGRNNLGGGSPSSWVATDPLFEIGNGTSSTRQNALTILKSGKMYLTPFIDDASLSDDSGYLIIGKENTINLVFDGNELMARDNGANSPFYLQRDGGNVSIGNVGVPNVALDVQGSIQYTGTIADVSDERLKENFKGIDNVLERVSKIKVYSYNMIDDATKKREYGVIAQELQKVFPEIVSVVDPEKGYLGVSYIQLIPVLLEAIKEQKIIIENQASKMIEQDSKINGLNAELNQIQDLAQRVKQIESTLKTIEQ